MPHIRSEHKASVDSISINRYFEVETRLVPVKASNGFIMDPNDALQYIDENTIGVMVILGSTYTGHFENVELMSHLCGFISLEYC